MRVKMDVNYNDFNKACGAVISKVGTATKKATKAACEEILEESLAQVPRETNTLASSAYYQIVGSYRDFVGVLGYGFGNPVNPKTGQPVSEYMVAVHEDLSAHHPTGKAKFLEDPIREWALDRFPRTLIKHYKPVLKGDIR